MNTGKENDFVKEGEFAKKLEKIWETIKGIPKDIVIAGFVVALGAVPGAMLQAESGGPSQSGMGGGNSTMDGLSHDGGFGDGGRINNSANLSTREIIRAGRTVNREVRAARRDADGIRALQAYLGKSMTDIQMQRVQEALREQFGDDLDFTLVGEGLGRDGLYRAKTIESIDRTPEL
ncbi:MAG: hypothetical protein FWC00_02170 [Firmicutes bacterium]|nr:hypothetical protein [Bacillota bacterium]